MDDRKDKDQLGGVRNITDPLSGYPRVILICALLPIQFVNGIVQSQYLANPCNRNKFLRAI
jgi:hypothetical protein